LANHHPLSVVRVCVLKAQNPSLFQFAGDAYVNEVGITNPFFPDESCPQGDCELLTRCNPSTKHPEDDGTDVDKFTSFMSFLAPAPPTCATSQTRRGRDAIFDAGCAECHKATLKTGRSDVAALGRVTLPRRSGRARPPAPFARRPRDDDRGRDPRPRRTGRGRGDGVRLFERQRQGLPRGVRQVALARTTSGASAGHP
jgi:hypothetical protein